MPERQTAAGSADASRPGWLWWVVGIDWAWLMVAGAAGASYLCVPETDHFRALVVVIAVLAIAQRILGPAWFAPVWVLAAAAVLAAGLYGATGRPSAVIGAGFAMVMLGLPVVVGRLRPNWNSATWARWALGALPTVASVAVARTGALASTASPAVVAAAIWGWAAAGAAALTVRFGSAGPGSPPR